MPRKTITNRLSRRRNGLVAGALLLALLSGCQRDDLCPATTQTTPRIVVEFQDYTDPGRLKAVADLVVIATDMEDTLLGPVNTNKINLPLRTNQNITEYLLIQNAGSPQENIDTIRFSYNRELQYLNRACGYKSNFADLQAIMISDQDQWIQSYTQFVENIEDEEETHLSFNH